ncbi:MAG: NYN domain-containing protein [Candidatus Parcubacteria bacterium]|nr:NYN domain-containing protein [Candidatus Parcubacteria bacterium]
MEQKCLLKNENKENVVYVFIDASNIWEVQKAKVKFFDYSKLRQFLKNKFCASEIQVFYYTAYPADGTRDYSIDGKHRFLTFLKKGLGFTVRKKELKRISIITEEGESIEEKGNMDVEITIDSLHHKNKYDIAVFFSGDSDFLALVSYLRNGGKKVYIFSSKNNISEELRTGSDGYFDVLALTEDIWGRDLIHRAVLKKDINKTTLREEDCP